VTKEGKYVTGATAWPRCRGALPLWCHGFCQRDNFVIEKFIPAPQYACKNTRHRDAEATPHTAERYSQC